MKRFFICRADKFVSLFLVLCLLSFTFSLMTSAKSSDTVPLVYRIKLHMIRDDVALHIKRGDSIIEAVGKYNIGKVSDIRYEACTAEVFSHSLQKNVISEYEGYCDITLSVSAEAVKNERGYSVNGYFLRMDKELSLRLPDFYGVGRIVSFSLPDFASEGLADETVAE